jgi:hypothetical protein
MSLIDHIYLLQHVHDRITHKSTGTPKEFAARLGISERKLYRILDELRDLGAEIVYNVERTSYLYGNEVKLDIHLRINERDQLHTTGGNFSENLDLLPILAVGGRKLVADSYWDIL